MKHLTKRGLRKGRNRRRKTSKRGGEEKGYEGVGTYDGDLVDGKRQGTGKMTYTNGDVYDGTWWNDGRYAIGKMTYADGGVYKGGFSDSVYGTGRSGRGKMTYANGDVYDGNWFDDKRKEYGRMKYANGDIYDGEWLNDMRQGDGMMEYADGDVYEGEWLNDMRQGNGSIGYANGETYEGPWVNDAPTRPIRAPPPPDDTYRIDPNHIHKFTANIDFEELNAFLNKGTLERNKVLPKFYPNQPEPDKFSHFIFVLMMSLMNSEKDTERVRDFKSVMEQRLNGIDYKEVSPVLLTAIYLSLKYALFQTPTFKEAYVKSYLDDTCMAHGDTNSLDNMSCIAGALERFITSLSSGATAALSSGDASEKQKIEYKELDEMITRNIKTLIQKLIEEWQYSHRKGVGLKNIVGDEQRRANLKEHIEETVTNDTPEINALIEELIKEFADPIGYDDDQFPQGGGRTRKQRRKGKRSNKKTKKRKLRKRKGGK